MQLAEGTIWVKQSELGLDGSRLIAEKEPLHDVCFIYCLVNGAIPSSINNHDTIHPPYLFNSHHNDPHIVEIGPTEG